MAEKEHTVQEIRQAVANALKETIARHTENLKQLRARELKRGASTLAKGELCLLCGNLPNGCNCITELKKNALLGYGPGTANSALAANEGVAKTDVDQVNREMGSFRSIAHNPVGPGRTGSLAPSTKINSGTASRRAGNPNRATAGTIANAKAETMPNGKLPKSKKLKGDEGSGGQIVKHGEMPEGAKPVGVGGKQPIGQGGGDAHKVPGGAPHPDTAASLADVKALNPASKWKSQGLPKLRAALNSNRAAKAAPAAAPPSKLSARLAPAAAKPAGNPGALQAVRDQANLAADKKAGGVGFLNSLFSRFRPAAKASPAAAAPAGSGPVRQQSSPYRGVRGMAALARSEGAPMQKSALGACAMCRKAEHAGMC